MKFKLVTQKDLSKIQNLFFKTFKKKMSKKFYKWRYFNLNSKSFINSKNKIIFHIGFVEKKINSLKKKLILSRHSSIVHEKFRRKGIYSNFFINFIEKKDIIKKYYAIVTWPNKINLKTFRNIKRKYFYKRMFVYSNKHKFNKSKFNTNNFNKINKIIKFKYFDNLESKVSFFYKDKNYLIKRYINDPHQKYFFFSINLKNTTNIIVFSVNNVCSSRTIIIQDFFGDTKNLNKTFEIFIKNLIKKKIPVALWKFWNNKNKPSYLKNFKILKNYQNIIIIPLHKKNIKLGKKILTMGDTDTYMKLS